MVIRARKNLYQGINAHLHSSLQNELAGWEVFHSSHVTHLAEAIDAQLPSGYLVEPEKSLQIREYHPNTGERVTVRQRRISKPDITIYQTDVEARRTGQSSLGAATVPTLTLPAIESLERDDEIYLTALAIREIIGEGKLGQPITWIELLSPTNKPPGQGYMQYREKRTASLEAGIALVEIDYLHETRSPIQRLASYPDREPDAYPYTIIVTNPRPSLQVGQMKVYGFHVDDPIPIVDVPLSGDEVVTLDFGDVYHRTYRSLGAYSYRVDYGQLPEKLENYGEADQERIKQRMKAVMEARSSGADLEQ